MEHDKENNYHNESDLIELIQATELFSDIHKEVAEKLISHLRHIKLTKGEVLFEEGETSETFYILVEGHLTAYLKLSGGGEKVIGTIGKGETVGELGALSNRPRSLSIRANTNSELLEISRIEFEALSREHPQMLFNIIHYIIGRSQDTIKLISEKKIHRNIAIIQGNSNTQLTQFFRMLQKNLEKFPGVIILDLEKSVNLNKEISEAEKTGAILVFYVSRENIDSLKLKLTHVGSLYVVVDGDKEPEFSDFALEMTKGRYSPFITDIKLVLLHDDKIVMPSGTIRWLKKINVIMHHHLCLNDSLGYQSLIRFMIGKPIGVVLSGGGGKGWASLGALKAFVEHDIPIDAIGGTSVGAYLGACFAARKSFDEIVEHFSKLIYKPMSLYNFTWPIISLLSGKKSTILLQKFFGDLQIENLWVPFFSMATNLTTEKEVVHHTGSVWERIRASMSIPGIAPPVVIDKQIYVDGGLMNNLPVDIMRGLLGKEAKIIAISLSYYKQKNINYNFPPIIPFYVGLLKSLGLGYKDYKFPPFFNTFISSMLAGSSAREKANKLLADILISPDLGSFKTLKVDIEDYHKLMKIGYLSMREALRVEMGEYFIL